MYDTQCKHENLKYFKDTNRVVCLDCGEVFVIEDKSNKYIPVPNYTPSPTTPNWPEPNIYPTIT